MPGGWLGVTWIVREAIVERPSSSVAVMVTVRRPAMVGVTLPDHCQRPPRLAEDLVGCPADCGEVGCHRLYLVPSESVAVQENVTVLGWLHQRDAGTLAGDQGPKVGYGNGDGCRGGAASTFVVEGGERDRTRARCDRRDRTGPGPRAAAERGYWAEGPPIAERSARTV